MEVTLEKNVRPAEQVNPIMIISRGIQKAFFWVNWFFTMTKVDRYNAGIDLSSEGRE